MRANLKDLKTTKMRIATLQFDAALGDVKGNIEKADSLLSGHREKLVDLDLLVLPELAFAGKFLPLRSLISWPQSAAYVEIPSYMIQAIITSPLQILNHTSSQPALGHQHCGLNG